MEKIELAQEYPALRAEIITWTTIQYSLIAITASTTAISLSIFRVENHWVPFSAAMITIVASLGFLTAHAHAKITLTGAYITVFHSSRTIWDRLITGKFGNKWTIASISFFPSVFIFYMALYTILFVYPLFKNDSHINHSEYKLLILPTILYMLMLLTFWRSGNRKPYEKIWRELKAEEERKYIF